MAGPLQAEVPREFGKSLRACVCCKLVKTFDQVRGMRETFAAILLSLLVARQLPLLVVTVRLKRRRRRDQTCT
jgi:hypothetical protein